MKKSGKRIIAKKYFWHGTALLILLILLSGTYFLTQKTFLGPGTRQISTNSPIESGIQHPEILEGDNSQFIEDSVSYLYTIIDDWVDNSYLIDGATQQDKEILKLMLKQRLFDDVQGTFTVDPHLATGLHYTRAGYRSYPTGAQLILSRAPTGESQRNRGFYKPPFPVADPVPDLVPGWSSKPPAIFINLQAIDDGPITPSFVAREYSDIVLHEMGHAVGDVNRASQSARKQYFNDAIGMLAGEYEAEAFARGGITPTSIEYIHYPQQLGGGGAGKISGAIDLAIINHPDYGGDVLDQLNPLAKSFIARKMAYDAALQCDILIPRTTFIHHPTTTASDILSMATKDFYKHLPPAVDFATQPGFSEWVQMVAQEESLTPGPRILPMTLPETPENYRARSASKLQKFHDIFTRVAQCPLVTQTGRGVSKMILGAGIGAGIYFAIDEFVEAQHEDTLPEALEKYIGSGVCLAGSLPAVGNIVDGVDLTIDVACGMPVVVAQGLVGTPQRGLALAEVCNSVYGETEYWDPTFGPTVLDAMLLPVIFMQIGVPEEILFPEEVQDPFSDFETCDEGCPPTPDSLEIDLIYSWSNIADSEIPECNAPTCLGDCVFEYEVCEILAQEDAETCYSEFELCQIQCMCGNGIIDQVFYEQCDPNSDVGNVQLPCTSNEDCPMFDQSCHQGFCMQGCDINNGNEDCVAESQGICTISDSGLDYHCEYENFGCSSGFSCIGSGILACQCSDECGDENLDEGEECDDGNTENGDGCDSQCILEICGNGVTQFGEECDDGNLICGDGCSPNCQSEVCGNEIADCGEACDSNSISCELPSGGTGVKHCKNDCSDYDECVPCGPGKVFRPECGGCVPINNCPDCDPPVDPSTCGGATCCPNPFVCDEECGCVLPGEGCSDLSCIEGTYQCGSPEPGEYTTCCNIEISDCSYNNDLDPHCCQGIGVALPGCGTGCGAPVQGAVSYQCCEMDGNQEICPSIVISGESTTEWKCNCDGLICAPDFGQC